MFNDTIESDEQGKVNGREPGQPRVSLTDLRKDKAAQSWLFEKYFNMSFVNRNPESDDPDAPPLPDQSKWEHRRIQNVVWSRRIGWVVDTVIIGDDSGDSQTYFIDALLHRMIRDSPANSRQIKSKIALGVATPPNNNDTTVSASSQTGTGSESDSGQVEDV